MTPTTRRRRRPVSPPHLPPRPDRPRCAATDDEPTLIEATRIEPSLYEATLTNATTIKQMARQQPEAQRAEAQQPAAQQPAAQQPAAQQPAAQQPAAQRLDPTSIHIGDVLADRYRVERFIGRSRGLLLQAAHTGFDKRVTVRIIAPALADPKQVDRFHRETRVLSKLESEHAARIMDVGTLPCGSHYLVREHLDGENLAAYVERRGALPIDEALLYFLQMAEAVQEAHSHNIALRDLSLKGAFLIRKKSGACSVKITEFGTCKVFRQEGGDEQSCTRLLGLSPSASPEMLRRLRDIDGRTDVWSLGCALYQLLTGEPPFAGDGVQLMLAIAQSTPRSPSVLRPDIPRALGDTVLRALCKDRNQRFASVYELARELRRHASPQARALIDQIAHLAGFDPNKEEPSRSSYDDEATITQSVYAPPPRARHAAHAVVTALPEHSVPPAMPSRRVAIPGARAMHTPAHHETHSPASPWTQSHALADDLTVSEPSDPTQPKMGIPPCAPQSIRELSWADDIPPRSTRFSSRAPWIAAFSIPAAALLALVIGLASGDTAANQAQLSLATPVAAAQAKATATLDEASRPTAASVAKNSDASRSEVLPSREHDTSADDTPTSTPAQRAARRSNGQFTSMLRNWDRDHVAAERDLQRAEAREQRERLKSERRALRSASSKKKNAPKKNSATAQNQTTGNGGVLAATAIGASCAFSIDGVSRGVSSSVRVSVAPGKHVVTCRASDGGQRSRTVTVAPGKAAVAVFKL